MPNGYKKTLMARTQSEIDVIYDVGNQLKHGLITADYPRLEIDFKHIKMGAYDEALLNYCNSVILHNTPHSKTDWVLKVQNLVCIGRLDSNEVLDTNAIERRSKYIPPWDRNKPKSAILACCNLTPEKWIFYKSIEREPWPFTAYGNVKFYTKELLKKIGISRKDRVLDIIGSIEDHGLLPSKFFETDIPVLAKLYEKNVYIAMTGRHRIAAMRYLAKQKNFEFETVKIPTVVIESDHFALSEEVSWR